MMKAYFQLESKQFITNKKNIALLFIIICAALYYVLIAGPAYEPVEAIDEAVLETKTQDRRNYVNNYDPERDQNGYLMMAKMNFESLLEIDEPRLAALKKEDLTTYTKLSSESYDLYNQLIGPQTEGLLRYNSKYFKYGQPASYSEQDAAYGYYMTARRYENYVEKKVTITPNILEEKTALQHIERLFAEVLPFVLLIVGIFLVLDIVSKDYYHTTLLFGIPLNTARRLIIKYTVSLISFTSLSIIGILIIYLGIGLRFGFGPLNLPITTYLFNGNHPISLPMWQYLGQNFILILLHFSIIFWTFALLTLITKVEFINLFPGVFYLLADRLYYGRGKGFFFDYTKNPLSYVRTGNALSGYDNFYYHTEKVFFSFKNGLISLSLTLLIIFIITILWTKRPRFRSL